MCGEPRSKHALIQKRPEIKKNKFFYMKVRATLKLKTNRNYSVYERAFPPQRPALYAKVFYCFNNRVKRKIQTLA